MDKIKETAGKMSDRMQELAGTKEKSTSDKAFDQAEHAKGQAQGVRCNPVSDNSCQRLRD